MTVIKSGSVNGFLAGRPKGFAVALFYGPDQGLVRNRAATLGKHVVDDPHDPFNAIDLSEGDLESPGQIVDEAAALSFMGGERLIRIKTAGDKVGKGIKLLLDGVAKDSVKPNALVVIEGGDLKKTSALRKVCEASPHAGVVACYPEEGAALLETIKAKFAEEGLTIEDEALMALSAHLGDDRGVTASEIEKLILYKGPAALRDGPGAITKDDVAACLTDGGADAPYEIADIVIAGETDHLSSALHAARSAGVSTLAVHRILQGKLMRLLTVYCAMDEGQPKSAAIKSLKPPVFYSEQQRFDRQLTIWPRRRLERALDILLEAEFAAKSTGMPSDEIVERSLFRLSASGQRR